jgi:peptidyl-prolyl cis-trans isomerase B (cyclophilin B)
MQEAWMRLCLVAFVHGCICAFIPVSVLAQTSTRFAILQAEEHGAASARELLIIKSATRGRDIDTVRAAIRALGRLERPSQIPDLLLSLRHSLPEVRVEAANAIAQAAQGFLTPRTPPVGVTVVSAQTALIARLTVEDDASVRAALCEAIARLPYKNPADVERAEATIVSLAASGGATSVADRLGVAKGLEALARIQRSTRPAGAPAVALLQAFVRQAGTRSGPELLRDARVRRLALEGLTNANALDDDVIAIAATDPDPQVRRLAMRAAAMSGAGMTKVTDGLLDPVALVRLEALRALRSRGVAESCAASVHASSDADMAVALVAIDQLGACGRSPAGVAVLERAVTDRSEIAAERGWHRNAHALVALAAAAPERAAGTLDPYATSKIWQVRMYAARAAAALLAAGSDRTVLESLANDPDDRVANAALAGLGAALRPPKPHHEPSIDPPAADDLRRLAAPRAIVIIRDVGRFELALLTSEAPASVLRFVQLAQSGYYNGLTFDRIAPNAIVQGGRRMSEEARYPHPEVGTWPHVRGVVGLSMPDTNDAQFFINLVDNPRFDHEYTVFAQILNGADIVDEILEGDVIESIAIIP